ncbi:NADPH-dependent FMN reductase [Amycolatopsis pigmentata]|uniref:NADPH-dependent FMN reductase n=1 Tax=Amycolatopsis pigmentata TaxID=450801 RepID=A0ABW5FK04_9PSEU
MEPDQTRPVLAVIIGSVRPGRIGPAFATWFTEVATRHNAFDVTTVDLAEIGLPFHDEPNHPKTGIYLHEHTRRWSRIVDATDAFVLVTPEYNYGYSPVLKNALDYLHREWVDKPVAFLGYGGVGAGTRAIQQLKQVVTTLRMVPIFEAVTVPFAPRELGHDGQVVPNPDRDTAAHAVLDELARLTAKLRGG